MLPFSHLSSCSLIFALLLFVSSQLGLRLCISLSFPLTWLEHELLIFPMVIEIAIAWWLWLRCGVKEDRMFYKMIVSSISNHRVLQNRMNSAILFIFFSDIGENLLSSLMNFHRMLVVPPRTAIPLGKAILFFKRTLEASSVRRMSYLSQKHICRDLEGNWAGGVWLAMAFLSEDGDDGSYPSLITKLVWSIDKGIMKFGVYGQTTAIFEWG